MDLFLSVPLALAALILLWLALAYNGFVRASNQVKNAWKQIDVQLKRRRDLIPNLVETVKDYMAYEQETLAKVTEARTRADRAASPAEAIAAEGVLSGALGHLFAVMENYPDLKANQTVGALMEELRGTENKIAFARQFYNDSAMALNNAVQSFPNNLIAKPFGFADAAYFEIPAADAEPVKVDLR